MKPHPRIRKSAKWEGLGASVVFTLVWLSSGVFFVGFVHPKGIAVALSQGELRVAKTPAPGTVATHWSVHRMPPDIGLWFRTWGRGTVRGTCIPLWIALAPVWLITVALWRHDRRVSLLTRMDCCLTCGYDLRGLPAGAGCPECGAGGAKKD